MVFLFSSATLSGGEGGGRREKEGGRGKQGDGRRGESEGRGEEVGGRNTYLHGN